MTPENSVFVPLDQLGYRPTPENQPLPVEHEFAGEALFVQADELIERDHRLNPEQREQARQRLHEVVDAHTMNAPVLLLNMMEDSDSDITRAAYATSEVWLHGQSRGDWALAMYQYNYDFRGNWTASTMHYSMWTFLGDVRSGIDRLLVGEQEVAGWLQARSLTSVHHERPSLFHFDRDINILRAMQKANMPIDYLGLTEQQRERMSNIIATYAIEDQFSAQNSYDLIEYLLGIQTAEARTELYKSLAEELVELLPATHTEQLPLRLLSVVESLSKKMTTIEGQPNDIALGERARQTLLMAHLYRKRSQMTFDPPEPLPRQTYESVEGIEQLPTYDYQLNIFAKNDPSLAELWRDIDYINFVGSHVQQIEHKSHLTEVRAKTLSAQVHRLLMDNTVSLGDLPPVFSALEIMFTAEDDSGRRQLYTDVLYALSQELPLSMYSRGNLSRVVGILEVMLPRMPDSLRNYRGDDLRGPAEVAAVIADMYDYRASFYIQADITRTGQDQD